MKIKDEQGKNNNRLSSESLQSVPIIPEQKKLAIIKAITDLKANGIKDWEILDTWAEVVYSQGKYAIADTLANAAYELGKPIED